MATTVDELIYRRFTKVLDDPANAGKTVYDLFEWSKRDVHLTDYKTGKVLCDMHDLEFPAHYSQNAVDIIASKYFRRAGVPGEGHETSMRQVAHRMVDFWVAALVDEGMIDDDEQAQILYDELVYLILDQRFAPNSPQWFNTGLKRAYGIAGEPQGMYYVDPDSGEVVESPDQYSRTQASACFIVSVQDKLLGDHSISDEYVTETKLFKGGSGTGSNFSALRAEGERLSGGGVSSGVMSFLRGFDRNADAIKSGGTTRRAAKMVCLDIDHPDIEKFITWKAHEEDKALALMKMGYDGDINGEAYATVSGQNSNNSLRIDNEFMAKVMNLDEDPDATYELKGRVDPAFNHEVSVKHIWDIFNESAWRCADPAPQFSDTFNEWHTCPGGEDGVVGAFYNRLNSTNPCGEYAFLDDSSCNLASINVYRFFDPATDTFDIEGYEHTIDIVQLALEASIAWGQFPTKDIARKTYRFRATGLGMSNLASLLMAKGLPYDSPEARAVAAALAGVLTGRSYAASAIMARKIGPFDCYAINKRYMARVIRNHARVAGARTDAFEDLSVEPPIVDFDLLTEVGESELASALIESWTFAEELGERYGYRNAQVSVMAPTGTISFAMDCGATSIEPFFSHMAYKKLSGGGFMTIANPVIEDALRALGYTDEEVADIVAYVQATDENGMIVDGKIEGAPHLKPEHLPTFDTANVCGSGKRYIAPRGHVLMVAALTPLVSGAISKTVNLPRTATVDDFKDVVLLAWQTGVKGITLYRDGSKNAQPLNTTLEEAHDNQDLEELSYAALLEYARGAQRELAQPTPPAQRRRVRGIRNGHTHLAQIDGVKIYTTVNRNEDGKISELFVTTDREGTTIMGLLNSLSKTISVMLQYGIPAENISKMLRGQMYEPYGFVQSHPNIKYVTSISDLISKVIDIELGDYTRVQVKPDGWGRVQGAAVPRPTPAPVAAAEVFGFEPAVSTEELDRLVAVKEDELREDTGTLDKNDYYTAAFVNEAAYDTALHGERLYDGSTCPTCGSSRMVQNGTCKVCMDCGTTTGCS
ncbi:MAG TPA: vitamin B12-dependent ribonucleotide reductase [Candidatus Limicola stercorigallinarum]|nr:vitamin B12-dependent ribonucleotide reductase [Candidatus Limicola stercorigallinarum]